MLTRIGVSLTILLVASTLSPARADSVASHSSAALAWDIAPLDRPRAQAAAAVQSASVTFVLKERFSDPGLVAAVRRKGSGSPNENLIAFRRSALTPELFAAAVAALSRSRTRDGNLHDKSINIYFKAGLRYRPVAAANRAWVDRTIGQLLRASARNIPGVGHVPALTIEVSLGE